MNIALYDYDGGAISRKINRSKAIKKRRIRPQKQFGM